MSVYRVLNLIKIPLWAAFLLIIGVGAIIVSLSGFSNIEGFAAGDPAVRCGVDLPECAGGLACTNGFCLEAGQPILKENELPVRP
jgi:hypothetical protein